MPLKIIKTERKSKYVQFKDLEVGEIFRNPINNFYYLKIRDNFGEKALSLTTFYVVDFIRSLKTEIIRSEIVMETE